MKATATGPYTCEIAFRNGDPSGSVTLLLTSYSYIGVDGPQHPGARMRRQEPDPADPDRPGIRLDIGQAADVAVDDNFIIPDLTRPILFTGDVQWTSCRRSDDEVKCTEDDTDTSATIGFHVSVFQWNSTRTGYCSTWSAPFTMEHIDGTTVHHAVTYSAATFVPNPSCPAAARIKIYVKNFGGHATDGALAIHLNNTTVLEAMPK